MMQYFITTWLNDELVNFRRPLADPFVQHRVYISWWDRFKSLFKKNFVVWIVIDGDKETIYTVMNLNNDAR